MDLSLLRPLLHRLPDINKYDFGHVAIVGGSSGMVGAPLLAARAALRIGAGLVTIASDSQTADKLERRVEEVMTIALPAYGHVQEVSEQVTAFIRERKVSVMVIGGGLRPDAAASMRRIVADASVPIVLDAGGLTAFRGHTPELAEAAVRQAIILTPHTGEYAKLTGAPVEERDIRDHAVQFAVTHHLTLVLKGHPTLVIHPNGAVYKNTTGGPGLATAGTGDVLTGVIAGLIAQGVASDQAVELGVYLHGLAGDLAATTKTQAGMIASDVVDTLPAALKRIHV